MWNSSGEQINVRARTAAETVCCPDCAHGMVHQVKLMKCRWSRLRGVELVGEDQAIVAPPAADRDLRDRAGGIVIGMCVHRGREDVGRFASSASSRAAGPSKLLI